MEVVEQEFWLFKCLEVERKGGGMDRIQLFVRLTIPPSSRYPQEEKVLHEIKNAPGLGGWSSSLRHVSGILLLSNSLSFYFLLWDEALALWFSNKHRATLLVC